MPIDIAAPEIKDLLEDLQNKQKSVGDFRLFKATNTSQVYNSFVVFIQQVPHHLYTISVFFGGSNLPISAFSTESMSLHISSLAYS
jgi:hypothetical protein